MVPATCKSWSDDDGWGVLVSMDVPGEIFAHFSYIEGPGFKTIKPGEKVMVDWEEFPEGQDGYFYRAPRIVRST